MILSRVVPLLLALWTGAAPSGEVDQVRIAPAGGETEITIFTRGEVQVRDFQLQDPTRLIVDLEGARHGLPRYTFEGIGRGGVVRMRSSQFRDEVVRLVFDLSRPLDYGIERVPEGVKVRFTNPGGSFTPWSTGAPPAGDRTRAGAVEPPPSGDGSGSQTASRGSDGRASVQEAPSQQPRISVTYEEADILDVLAGFAEFSGMSIVPASGVAGRTVQGVEIRNKPWDVALDAILAAQGLGWKRLESGIILVDELSAIRARDTLQTETRVMRVNYADAADVSQALGSLKSERGQVVSYPGTNSVIVTDAPSVVSRMDSLVRVMDRRTPQVSIQAKIVFVDRTSINALGLTYDLKDLRGDVLALGPDQAGGAVGNPDPANPAQTTEDNLVSFGGNAVAALANANQNVPTPALTILSQVSFGDFSLFTFLDALQEQRLSDIQAAPSVQVADNENARIQVGEETAVRVIEQGGQTQQAQATVQFVDTGIILDVTPHITNNNQILLELNAERSGIQEASADVGFIFNKQEAETRLLLDDGETAVIGGLTASEVTRNEAGVPLLMDLPLIGGLFRTTSQTENKQDLIILVTPHIVPPPGGMPAGASAQS